MQYHSVRLLTDNCVQSMIETVAKMVEQVENIKTSSVTFLYFQKEQLCNFNRR